MSTQKVFVNQVVTREQETLSKSRGQEMICCTKGPCASVLGARRKEKKRGETRSIRNIKSKLFNNNQIHHEIVIVWAWATLGPTQ